MGFLWNLNRVTQCLTLVNLNKMASRFICLVTGGASGLGRATAHRLVRNGARVVIADLPSSDGNNVAKEFGENCAFAPTDVSVFFLYFTRSICFLVCLLLIYFSIEHVEVSCARDI